MSLETIRPYFQGVMRSINKEFREWEDAFNVENIPNSQLDCAYHILIGTGTLVSLNQHCLQMDVPVTLNAWEKGFRSTLDAVDFGVKRVEAITKESCRHSRRLGQPFIKNVLPTRFNVEPINLENDNIARLVMEFTLRVFIELET